MYKESDKNRIRLERGPDWGLEAGGGSIGGAFAIGTEGGRSADSRLNVRDTLGPPTSGSL